MIKKVFYALAMISGLAVNAQDVEVKWGAVSTTERAIAENDAGQLVIVKDEDYGIDKKSSVVFNKEYIYTASHIYGLVHDEKATTVSLQEVSNKGKLIGNPIKLNIASRGAYVNKKNDVRYFPSPMHGFFVSQNKKMVVFCNSETKEIEVFDEDVKAIFKKNLNTLPIPDDAKSVGFGDISVTNSGDVVVLAKCAKKEKIDQATELYYYFRIYVIGKNGVKDARIDLPKGKNITSLKVQELAGQKFVVAGTYSRLGNDFLNSSTGTFIGNFDAATASASNLKAFEYAASTFERQGTKFKTEVVLQGADANKIVQLEDGEFLLVVERTNNYTGGDYWTGYLTTSSYSAFGKVVVAIGKDFSKKNETSIEHKAYVTGGLSNQTSTFAISGNRILLLYNTGEGRFYRMKATILDANAKIVLDKEVDAKMDGKDGYYFFPRISREMAPNKIMVGLIEGIQEVRNFGVLTVK